MNRRTLLSQLLGLIALPFFGRRANTVCDETFKNGFKPVHSILIPLSSCEQFSFEAQDLGHKRWFTESIRYGFAGDSEESKYIKSVTRKIVWCEQKPVDFRFFSTAETPEERLRLNAKHFGTEIKIPHVQDSQLT
jgi:hypothetical protein